MPRQDVDPLADTLPPRYAYESDDEDELDVLRIASEPLQNDSRVEIHFLPPTEKDNDAERGGFLIITSGGIGSAWARGANIGEQVGQVNVNKRAIGLIFRTTWAGRTGTIVISEALTRLPVWAMSSYATAVLDRWNPSKVILLDAYSTATYISSNPIPHHEAPIRYLSTGRNSPPKNSPLSLFAPPNLLQSTTAAFLNLLSLPSLSQKTRSGFVILVPSRRAPLPTPRTLSREEDESTSVDLFTLSGIEDSEDRDPALLRQSHREVLGSAGIRDSAGEWSDPLAHTRGKMSAKPSGRRRLTETEEGMYI